MLIAHPGPGSHRAGRIEVTAPHVDAMTDPIADFTRSLETGEAPSDAAPLLRAVWLGLRGEWEEAHELAQAQDDAGGARVHAWLHRIEGDAGNAGYWYRRAGRTPASGDTRTEGLDIAAALIAEIQ
jgi:hypothetical protein